MASHTASPSLPPKQQSLLARLFWFGTGGGFSVLLNLGPFHWLTASVGLSKELALALSLTLVTLLFGVWNYTLNFRTHKNWASCIPRYLAALGFCSLLTYGISLAGIKRLALLPPWDGALIGATQVSVSGIKFLLYHYWVYPRS